MLREIVPNVAPPVLVYAMIVMANLIVIEAAVSFLGLGIPPPRSSWGGMVADGQKVMTLHPWQVFCPAGMIVLTVFALHVIGDEIHTRVTGQHGGVG
jgi:peptide/nickel transport system permease protein